MLGIIVLWRQHSSSSLGGGNGGGGYGTGPPDVICGAYHDGPPLEAAYGYDVDPLDVDGCEVVHGLPLFMLDASRFLRVFLAQKSAIDGNQTALLDFKARPNLTILLG